jgi:hypothetical protein
MQTINIPSIMNNLNIFFRKRCDYKTINIKLLSIYVVKISKTTKSWLRTMLENLKVLDIIQYL